MAATAVGHSLVSAAGQRPPSPSADPVPARVHAVLTAYDAQGAHRTGTDVDRVSGEWLKARAEAMGGAARLEPFALDRLDVKSAFIEIGKQKIEGQPLFDSGLTRPTGILAPVDPSRIHLVTGDEAVAVLRSEGTSLEGLRRNGVAQAIVVVQPGARPGLVVANARHFTAPYGCPVLQLAPGTAGALAATWWPAWCAMRPARRPRRSTWWPRWRDATARWTRWS